MQNIVRCKFLNEWKGPIQKLPEINFQSSLHIQYQILMHVTNATFCRSKCVTFVSVDICTNIQITISFHVLKIDAYTGSNTSAISVMKIVFGSKPTFLQLSTFFGTSIMVHH